MGLGEKQLYAIIVVLVIALASISGYFAAYAQRSYQQLPVPVVVTGQGQGLELKTITVIGMGSASAKPNRAELRLGVATEAPSAVEALQRNAELMVKVVDALKALGIPEENIETLSYSLYPKYSYSTLVGFTATHMLKVTTTNLEGVGQIVDKAVEAGANRVQGIHFTLTEDALQKLKDKARREAVEDAKVKAETIASSLGVSIIGIASAEESYYQPRYGGIYLDVSTAKPAPPTPIMPPSEMEVRVTVKVAFVIG